MKYPDYLTVQKCLSIIEEQLGWGSSDSWHSDVFVELSEKIRDHTQVLLSPTTLKRIWGHIDYKSSPSISTLNALAQFAGHTNWRDFKSSLETRKNSKLKNVVRTNLGIIMVSAAIMTVVFISFYSLTGVNNKAKVDNFSKVTFKSTSVAKGLPNTVVFDFNLEGIVSDSLKIQQFWDPSKTIELKREQSKATGQYYYPGYFRAKLLVDNTIIKEHDLYIKSEGWMGTIGYDPIPKYIKNLDVSDNRLFLEQQYLNEIDSNEQPLISTFHYVEEFGPITGDNFELNTRLKNVYNDKWAVCQTTRIVVLGTKSALIIPFSIPGCSSELGVMLSENYLSGKENDLSSLGIELSNFRNIKLKVVDKNITVFVDDTALFSNSYTKSIGDIAGVRFQFLGAGQVSEVSVRSDGEKVNLLN